MEVPAGSSKGLSCENERTGRVAVRERIWVGIDVGKAAHHACAVDETGKVVFSQRVDNGQAAIEQLIARAGKAAVQVRWAVDLTSGAAGLLVVLLLTTGQPVAYVSGQTVNRMAGVFSGEGKTDAKDARVIAQTCRMRGDLPQLSVPDQVVTDLAVLTARRADLMNDWVRDVNRLRELLSSIFPSLEKALDCTTRAALTLLTGFQTPAAVRDAGEPGLTRHLHDLGVRPGTAHTVTVKALAAAAGQTVALPAEAVTAPLIARLARQLLDLDREAKDLTKQIGDTFRTHPGGRGHREPARPGTGAGRGVPGRHRRRPVRVPRARQTRGLRGPGADAPRLRSGQRQSAQTPALSPGPAPGVLHGRPRFHHARRPLSGVLSAQTNRG